MNARYHHILNGLEYAASFLAGMDNLEVAKITAQMNDGSWVLLCHGRDKQALEKVIREAAAAVDDGTLFDDMGDAP